MTNHLVGETSPYLLQHADNPVDWHPWNVEALKLALDQDRPILLSIGYSACHWCHVMAHESFEDEATAALMNRLYVNIKVDREERPDLDKIYQLAHQLMSQRPGGWPLTVVLDPKTHAPFFAGTYFPPTPRHGMPAFRELLVQVAEWYGQHKDQLTEQHTRLQAVFRQIESGAAMQDDLNADPIVEAAGQLREQFDPVHGGFGGAPKFPHPSNLEFLLRRAGTSGEAGDASMALFSLRRMAEGGIHDQLGGGFCRYSVDEYWMIPHFEKMLYDNGPLLALCTAATRLDTDPIHIRAANGIADWVMREMQSAEGGYYSSLDADSEGHEGIFYVWGRDEVKTLLGAANYALFSRCYGFDRAANFEGRWHLHTYVETAKLAEEFELSEAEVQAGLESARRILFAAREKRVRPGRDDKVLTSWNALMIRGMTIAARQLGRADCQVSARRALDFIREQLWKSGRLLATCKDGRAHLPAYLDDHAFLLDAVLEMLQTEWRTEDLQFACELADCLIEHFEDREDGGFFFTANDHEVLLHRLKPLMDESVPPGNGIAAAALARLGHLVGETRYLESSERCLRYAWNSVQKHPIAHTTMLMALEEYLRPPEVIILRGDEATCQQWREKLSGPAAAARQVFSIADGVELPAALARKKADGKIVAYVCRGLVCSAPLRSINELDAHLASTS